MAITNYLWDEGSYLEEYNEVGLTTMDYSNEPTGFENIISHHRDSATNFYLFDVQGSTHQLTDENENVTDTFMYDSWGNEILRVGTSEVPFRYVGQSGYYYDKETKSYYARARIFEPKIYRWQSLDPLGFVLFSQSGSPFMPPQEHYNLYSYVLNNPVIYTDPAGTSISIGGAAGAGGAVAAAAAVIYACAKPQDNLSDKYFPDAGDSFIHCWVSCRITKTCGNEVSSASQILKEWFDSRDRITGKSDVPWIDSLHDIVANQTCIYWEAKYLGITGSWIGALCRESCEDCCRKNVGYFTEGLPVAS